MNSYVPEHITLNIIFSALLLAALSSVVVGVSFAVFEVSRHDFLRQALRNSTVLLAYSFPVALVAYIAGYLSTMGRASAVAQLLPAVLALVGALNIYVFGTDSRYRFIISYCVCVFAGMLFYGTQYGAYKRDIEQETRLQELMQVEARLKLMRKNLQLDDNFPSWLLGSEPK
jgi:hypothetical protein